MPPAVVQVSRLNNPYYPLPADYPELDDDGQRLARVNACRQWLVHAADPTVQSDLYAASVNFFNRYYLYPDPADDFDPSFYQNGLVKSAPAHFSLLRVWGRSTFRPSAFDRRHYSQEAASIIVCPRGFSKSTQVRITNLMHCLTYPGWSNTYYTSSNDNAIDNGIRIKAQCTENRRIFDDFTPLPEFGGRIQPKRGERPWGDAFFFLTNGSNVRSGSVESRMRGRRPISIDIDDAEYEGTSSTSMYDRRANFEDMLFSRVLPMIQIPGAFIRWIATFISRRHYAWRAMQTIESPNGPLALDSRFNYWNRLVIRAAYNDDAGNLVSAWPDMWPVSEADILANPELRGRFSLERIRATIGTPSFEAEYMARPGTGSRAFFPSLTETQSPLSYWFSAIDGKLQTDPRGSLTRVHTIRDGTEHSMTLTNLLATSRLFMTVDHAYTENANSDFKVCCLMAHTPLNELYVLDLYCGKPSLDKFCVEILAMAKKWGCRSIHVEAIKESLVLYNQLRSLVNVYSRTSTSDLGSLPAIHKLSGMGTASKNAKISTLQHRFNHNLIKLPVFYRSQPNWSMLFEQLDGFNPERDDGGLEHDDALDAVSMSSFVIKSGVRALRPADAPEAIDLTKMVQQGRMLHPKTGLPLISSLDQVTPEIFDAVLTNAAKRYKPNSSRVGDALV
ncbi:MAG: hypothetical protein ACK4Y5_20815 [Acetobacteraceae bacterium]|jgi:hypothetical protein